MRSDYTDPLEVYVDSITAEVIEAEIIIPDSKNEFEASIMGLSNEKAEEFIFTLFFS